MSPFVVLSFTARPPNGQLVVWQKCVQQRCLLQRCLQEKSLEPVRTKVISSEGPLLTTLAKVLPQLFHILVPCLFSSVIILFVHSLLAAISLEGQLQEVKGLSCPQSDLKCAPQRFTELVHGESFPDSKFKSHVGKLTSKRTPKYTTVY